MHGHAYTAEALRPRARRAARRRTDATGSLAIAAVCVAAMALVWVLASQVATVQVRDAAALHHFTLLNGPTVEALGNHVLHLLDPLLFVLWGGAIVSVALARGLPRVAVAAAAVLCLAPPSAEKLKPLLAHPHAEVGGLRIGPASWPSGHATAGLALVLCAVLVTPARWRPLAAAVGAAYTVAVGLALLILAWHEPSDVLGGWLLASLWMALAVAGLRLAERRWPTRSA
jgi:membrane-associated phospholipid phosphatase